jgi:hypothetical protein
VENDPRRHDKMLYTIIAEFRRRHYVFQIRADSPQEAIEKWADDVDAGKIRDFGRLSKDVLRSRLRQFGVNAVQGLVNVYEWHNAIGGFTAAVYLIGTDES